MSELKNEQPKYKVYSMKLDTLFDSVEELTAAEEKAREAEETKKSLSEQRKTDAEKVKEAYLACKASKKAYNKNLIELRKEYNDVVQQAKSRYNKDVEALAATVNKATEDYNNLLAEFNKKYPGGFHLTLKETDDGVEVKVEDPKEAEDLDNAVEFLNRLIADFYKFW